MEFDKYSFIVKEISFDGNPVSRFCHGLALDKKLIEASTMSRSFQYHSVF